MGNTIAALEGVTSQTGGLLSKVKDALTGLHQSVFPKGQPPSSLDKLVDIFGPDTSTSGDYMREHTVRGSHTTLLLMLGHGLEGDYDKAVSGFPKGPDGKLLPLSSFFERSRELAQKLTETLEKKAANRVEKAKKSTSMQ